MREGWMGGIRRVVHGICIRGRMVLRSHWIRIHAIARVCLRRGVRMVGRVGLRKRRAVGGIGWVHYWELCGRKGMDEDRTRFRGTPLGRSRSLWFFARVRDERRTGS
jgi:hypothetical protein